MTVEHMMIREVVTVSMDETLATMQQLFAQGALHHLLVLEGERLVGVISDRDVLRALSPFISTLAERKQDMDTLNKKAHYIMSRKLVTATKETTIREAGALLVRHNISCLPVTSVAGCVEGIVTGRDIIRWDVLHMFGIPAAS